MDLGETVPSLCSETCLTLSADGSEFSDMRVEKDPLAVALPAVKAADKVCYVCNVVILTVVQACTRTLPSAFWQCVVWFLGMNLRWRWR
jgi:hypothetical protein